MSDNNSFLSNYTKKDSEAAASAPQKKESPATAPAEPSFKYEQKSGFKKPAPKDPKPPRTGDDSRKKLITAIAAGGGALVILIVVLVLVLGGGIKVLDFTNGKLSDAQLWANENGMIITTENAYSDTVEEGYVIEQDTPADSSVKKGSFIKLTVSLGHDLSVTLQLPDLTAMTADEVQKWADDNFMTKVRITTEFSADVPQGKVIRYEINDNTVVDEIRRDTPVYVIVSKGPETAAATVKVPDFKTKSLAECYTFATDNGLTLTVKEEFDDYIPAGTIMSQSVKADQMIATGSEIILVVSKGKMITVPDFSDYTKEEATALAAGLGLPVTITEKYSSSSTGRLISQSIEAGSIYEAGGLLELTFSLGNKIVVASYVGQTRDLLETWAKELNEQGAKITIKATEAKSSQPRGTVIFQDVANTSVSYKSTITITVSAGKVVYVPDFVVDFASGYDQAITRDKAVAMCEEAGLIPNFVMENSGAVLPGTICRQSLNAGTETSEGTVITLVYTPTVTVTVPGFVGKTVAEAKKYMNQNLIVFSGGDEDDAIVLAQSVAQHSTVASGSVITLTTSPGATETEPPKTS